MTTDFRPSADPLPEPTAAERLADLGFLTGADLPDRPGPAYLLVALRDHPTLRHYDPERVEYWVTRAGRGVRATLTRATPMPIEGSFSWGLMRLVDRLSVTNEYLTFGGRLSAAEIDGCTIAVFVSPVPMLRRGGHSQGLDEGTDEVGAFFGRLLAAVGASPAIEARLAAADPLVRYALFLSDVVERFRASVDLRADDPRTWTLLRAEADHMQQDQPEAWRAGEELLRQARRATATTGR